jgi:hypothetical protein
MSEARRGCGYRKIGGLYLAADPGLALVCDGLPLPLEPCGCCAFTPPFSRNLQRIQAEYIIQAEEKLHLKRWMATKYDSKPHTGLPDCSCPEMCPMCHSEGQKAQGISLGLMFVGAKNYTPESFIQESVKMGISKRIPDLPSWLKLGETWVFLAHQKVPNHKLEANGGLLEKEPEYMKAIFYGFKPQRVEMPVWKGDLTDQEILKLEEQGITPVLLERTAENLKRHKHAKNSGARLDKLLEETEK